MGKKFLGHSPAEQTFLKHHKFTADINVDQMSERHVHLPLRYIPTLTQGNDGMERVGSMRVRQIKAANSPI